MLQKWMAFCQRFKLKRLSQGARFQTVESARGFIVKLSRLLTNDKTLLMVCSKTHLMTAHSKERSFERPSNANVTVVDFKTVTVAGGAFLHNATNSATAMAGNNKAVREAVSSFLTVFT